MSVGAVIINWLVIGSVVGCFYLISIVLEASSSRLFMFGGYKSSTLNNIINCGAFMIFIAMCYVYVRYV